MVRYSLLSLICNLVSDSCTHFSHWDGGECPQHKGNKNRLKEAFLEALQWCVWSGQEKLSFPFLVLLDLHLSHPLLTLLRSLPLQSVPFFVCYQLSSLLCLVASVTSLYKAALFFEGDYVLSHCSAPGPMTLVGSAQNPSWPFNWNLTCRQGPSSSTVCYVLMFF